MRLSAAGKSYGFGAKRGSDEPAARNRPLKFSLCSNRRAPVSRDSKACRSASLFVSTNAKLESTTRTSRINSLQSVGERLIPTWLLIICIMPLRRRKKSEESTSTAAFSLTQSVLNCAPHSAELFYAWQKRSPGIASGMPDAQTMFGVRIRCTLLR